MYRYRATIIHKSHSNNAINTITGDSNGTIYFSRGSSAFGFIFKLHPEQPMEQLSIYNQFYCMIWNPFYNKLYLGCRNIFAYTVEDESTDFLSDMGFSFISGHNDGNFQEAQFASVMGLALDKNGVLYITDDSYVRKVNLVEETVETIAGAPYSGHCDGECALFNDPHGITVSNDGTIYVADTGNNCIRKIKDGIVSTVAGTGGIINDFDTPLKPILAGPVSQVSIPSPHYVFLDRQGNLLISDIACPLRIIDLKQNIVTIPKIYGENIEKDGCKHFHMFMDSEEHIYLGGNSLYKLENLWKREKYLWIGHSKESPSDCPLARVPKDIIREIAKYL